MPRSKHCSILVVDDDPSVLEVTSLLLEEFGYDIVSSPSADDAINRLETDKIDIVITDIVMPSMSGIELLREIHDIDPQKPVILMTAYADMEKVIDAIKIGAFDFIIKPFTSQLLVHSIEKAVNYSKLMQMEKDYKRLLEEYNQEIETIVSERTMSLMALTIADKIRNPSSVIGLICKRVLDKEEVPERLKSKLELIMEEAEKLDNIVKDFQSLLDSKKFMFAYEDINTVIDSVVSINENKAADKGIELVFSPAESSIKINLQKNLFQIAISHLIRNAIQATPEGGSIKVLIYEEGASIVLTISDTGYGINKDAIDRIFDPMFSTKEHRFGMGLPLVKRILSEHMGEIVVESTPGHGTTFRIKLPMRWIEKQ
ncbi:MAG: response regulator [Nitrospirota bacterium]